MLVQQGWLQDVVVGDGCYGDHDFNIFSKVVLMVASNNDNSRYPS